MLTPARMSQSLVELVFVLLGSLVIFLGVNQRIYFDRHGSAWLVLSVALIAWGLIALAKPGHWWAKWQKWNRGGSLILLGAVMLAISRVPFLWVPKLLVLSGLVLIARGILGSFLIFKLR
jgi:TM2 domain-containing membrane protein YozV